MFYGAKPEIFERARLLREEMTDAEKLLWSHLKENKMGLRFKPQHPAGNFILDFYCHVLKLAIELDGPIHLGQSESDQSRTEELEEYGIQVIRFNNNQLNNIDDVLKGIHEALTNRRQYFKDHPDG